MQRLIFAAMFGLAAGVASAAGVSCDKPEYLQLKSADKAELTDEFCRSIRRWELGLKQHAENLELFSARIAQGQSVSKDLARNNEELMEAQTCSKAASEYMGALERRFKLRKRPSCK